MLFNLGQVSILEQGITYKKNQFVSHSVICIDNSSRELIETQLWPIEGARNYIDPLGNYETLQWTKYDS